MLSVNEYLRGRGYCIKTAADSFTVTADTTTLLTVPENAGGLNQYYFELAVKATCCKHAIASLASREHPTVNRLRFCRELGLSDSEEDYVMMYETVKAARDRVPEEHTFLKVVTGSPTSGKVVTSDKAELSYLENKYEKGLEYDGVFYIEGIIKIDPSEVTDFTVPWVGKSVELEDQKEQPKAEGSPSLCVWKKIMNLPVQDLRVKKLIDGRNPLTTSAAKKVNNFVEALGAIKYDESYEKVSSAYDEAGLDEYTEQDMLGHILSRKGMVTLQANAWYVTIGK